MKATKWGSRFQTNANRRHFLTDPHVQVVAGHLRMVTGHPEMTYRQLQTIAGRPEMTDRQLFLAAGRLTTATGRVQTANRRPQEVAPH